MRLASFVVQGRHSYGLAADGDLREVEPGFLMRYPDLRSVLAANALPELASSLSDTRLDFGEIEFLPTIPNPDKTICVGVNYRPHVEEMGRSIPDKPVVFVRFPGSQVGHGQALVKGSATANYDFEGELAVVIGRTARHVSRAAAYEYIAGYCCFMDGTARDWQQHTHQFTPGKNFHASGALGPWLVSCDEIPEPGELQLQTRVNGVCMQRGAVSELIFGIPELVEYLSTFAVLLPGDVIATGTPSGVGAARRPPVWLRAGDLVEVDIPGVGLLANRVVDE